MFGRNKSFHPLFSRKKEQRRVPYSWILIGLFLMLFWLVPVYSPSLDISSSWTAPLVRLTIPPTSTQTPKATPEHGGRIVFTCTRENFNQLCLINFDGSGLQQLSSGQHANNYYPSFSPEGNSILFASNRNGYFDIYLMMFGQRVLYQITYGVGNVVSPDFSANGEQIVFANRTSDGIASIWLVNRNGTDPHLFFAGTASIVAVSWSPNGKTIAYAMQVSTQNEYQVYLINLDGSEHRQLTNNLMGIGGSLDWSPDGTDILIYAGPPGDKDIYRVDVETGRATRLTDGGNNAAPSYSPNGKYIAFNSTRIGNQPDIFIMEADGQNQRQLTSDPDPDWQPKWEPY